MPPTGLPRLLLHFLLLAALSGCSHQSVRHLERQPWILGTPQTLEMEFWTFHFEIVPMHEKFGIKGRAVPRKAAVPAGMTWIEDLWLGVYLSDARGRVLAQDLDVYVPAGLDFANGVGFDFILRPTTLESGPLFITFGYRMVLAPGPPEAPSGNRPPAPRAPSELFFASEGALTRL